MMEKVRRCHKGIDQVAGYARRYILFPDGKMLISSSCDSSGFPLFREPDQQTRSGCSILENEVTAQICFKCPMPEKMTQSRDNKGLLELQGMYILDYQRAEQN